MRHIFTYLFLLIGIAYAYAGSMYGYDTPTSVPFQSQQILTSGTIYRGGATYTPFDNSAPSEQSEVGGSNPNRAPGGPKKDKIIGPDTPPANEYPIGEPWILALFAAVFGVIIAIKKKKSIAKTIHTENNSTMKNINTQKRGSNGIKCLLLRRHYLIPILLFTIGVGQMWGADTYAIAGSMNSWSTTANTRSGTGAISITFSSTGNYTFKIVKNGTWCGNSGTMTRDNCTSWGFTYNGGDNCTISVDKTGTYTFTITNSTPTLTVTYPAATWSVAGEMNSWSTTANTFSDNKVSIDLITGTTKEFKIYRKEGNVYYGNSGTMTSANCTNWDFSSSAGNAKITANITGTYVFELVNNTPRITVHYPVAISYDKGTNGTGTISGGVKTWGVDYTLSSSTFTRAGYTQDGWSTSDGGDKAYNLGGTYSTHAAQTFYPHWVENTYTVTVNNDGHGTTSPSGAQSNVGQVTGVAISATANTNYEFVNWTITSGTGSFASAATTASNTFYPTSAATIKANFRSTLTYSLTVGAGAHVGTVTGSTNPVTLGNSYAITASNFDAGYEFYNWTASPAANATFANATNASTTVTINNGSVTVTANARETTYTVNVAMSDPSQSGGTTNPNGDTQVGAITPVAITAPMPATGYLSTGRWTTTGGVTVANPTAISTTMTATAAGTVRWTFDEDLSSPWIVAGGNKIVTSGATWRTTADGDNRMSKKTGHSSENKVYFTVPISTVCSGDNNGNYQFKIYNTSTGKWYGLTADGDSYYLLKAEDGTQKSLSEGSKNIELRAYIAGDYELELDYSTSTPKLTVSWPTINQLQVYTANELSTGDAAIGHWNWTSTAGSVSSKTLSLQAKTQYKFKVVYNSDYYGFKTGTPESGDNNPYNPMTIDGHTNWRMYDDGGDSYIYALVTGDYSFHFNSNNGGNTTLTVDFPTAYTVTFNKGTGGNTISASAPTAGGEITSGSYVAAGDDVTFTQTALTGYTFAGWYDAETGGAAIPTMGVSDHVLNGINANKTVWSRYAANEYTVTLDADEEHKGNIAGATTSQTVTYNAATTTVPNLPTAETNYGLDGYYTDHNGGGVKLINGDGTWIASVAGYTDGSKNWIHDGNVTLYAYYAKAAIIGVTLNASIFEPATADGDKVYVTANPIVSPAPTGPAKLCWELRYSNDNPIDGHAPISETEGGTKPNQVKFEINGLASGGYKIHVELWSGSDCNSGTLLSSYDKSFSIADDHTVTIQYRLDSLTGPTIQASTTNPGEPLEWTEITAPDITGFAFVKWKAGDGITIEDADANGEKTSATINYKANYDGKLTAIYTQKQMVYFYNTLGWNNVYVYFYNSDEYWDNTYGSGAKQDQAFNGDHKPYWEQEHGTMTQIEGTNIWFYDCSALSERANVAFTKDNQHTYQWFYQTEAARRTDYNHAMPMFVPLADTYETKNDTKYYNEGYWMNYPVNTGYTLKIFNDPFADNTTGAAREYIFPFSEDIKLPLKQDVEFNFTGQAWFIIYKNDGTFLGVNATMTQESHDAYRIADSNQKIELKTSAPGTYTFTLTYYDDGVGGNQYHISVDYPVGLGDYRILYQDNAKWSQSTNHNGSWWHASDIIRKNSGLEVKADTVSLFVAHGSSPSAKFQYVSAINASTGAVTWTDVTSGAISLTSISTAGVYNFIVSQPSGGSSISLTKTEEYTGNFYIRTDCAGNTKWDNYRAADHKMTYTEFSMSAANSFGEKFSHYFAHWCPAGTNIQFCIANDYSACISDTLLKDIGEPYRNLDEYGTLLSDGNGDVTANRYSANVRFMYNATTNKISRAYVSAATNAARKFLVLYCEDGSEILDENGSALAGTGETARQAIFHDNENFIYERILQIVPGTRFKLFASYALKTATRLDSVQYFRGAYDSDAFSSDANSVILLSGTGGAQKIRIIYDFKTNRLVAAWMPTDMEISGILDIDADVMIVRDHQGPAECITFANAESKLTDVKTVYGAIKFNRWTLNNRARGLGGIEDNTKEHAMLENIATYHPILDAGEQKSIYERSLYFISFPFDVKLSEVFGFGHYWDEWYIEYYDGLNRAKNGYWKDSPPNWKYVTPAMAEDFVLEAYTGYILGLDLDYMLYDNTTFWANNISNVELYFPSQSTMSTIEQTEVTIPALSEEYRCTINRGTSEGDRRIKDSFWRCIGVPSYDEFAGNLTAGKGGSTITWQTSYSTFPFLYAWNMGDNTLTPQSTSTFAFKPMHSYLVQIQNAIYWDIVSATPSPIVARRERTESIKEYNWRLTLSQGENFIDQTYVRMSDNEQVTDSFDFGQDMIKELNNPRSNIYTLLGYERLAANSIPVEETSATVIPVGLNIKTTGDYTFSIPDGTSGVGITLVDTEAGINTSLSALDYTINLTAGTYDNRFLLEISPIQQTPTSIENTGVTKNAHKVLINGILYIVRDGKLYDARGARVE